jgi:hypothetical protein
MTIQGVAPFAFLTHDVLSWVPDGLLSRSGQWTTPRERMDVPSGAFAYVAPGLYPAESQRAVYRCFSRADRSALWTWLAAQLGRYGTFWCPTFQRDFDILDAGGVGGGFGTWLVRYSGYAARLALDPSAKYLYAFRAGGSDVAALEVTSATDNGDGTESIVWAFGARAGPGLSGATDITCATATGACQLRFSRLDEDTLVSSFSSTELCDIAIAFASITGEQP